MNKKEIEKNLNYFLRRFKIPEFKERKIKEADFERILFTNLIKMGVPVLIESNRRL